MVEIFAELCLQLKSMMTTARDLSFRAEKSVRMSEFREFDWIKSLPQSIAPDLKVGIGDDAAVFGAESEWVISTILGRK